MNFSIFRCRTERNDQCGVCGRGICLSPGLGLRGRTDEGRPWQFICHYCGFDEAPVDTIELLQQRKGVAWDGLSQYYTMDQVLDEVRNTVI